MKGKDILKALECCNDDAKFCVNCPYYDEEGKHKELCVYRLHKDIKDLIYRLKTERNKYKYKAQAQRGELARLNKQVTEQKAEIETLKTNNNSLCITLQNRARVERNEAIKEFAERVKEKRFDGIYPYVLINDIANLVKELAEVDL